MWPCYGVHITVCMVLLVFVLCQPVHSCIEPSLHGVDFFLEIFFMETKGEEWEELILLQLVFFLYNDFAMYA